MSEYKRLKMPLWVVVLGLGFSFLVLSISAHQAPDRLLQIRAQEVEEQEGRVTIEEKITPGEVEDEAREVVEEVKEEVDYYLSYPGLLPDHPLYWLKMVRDRVQLWLTTKPLARSEKLLLYADKRLGAGWALVDGNKKQLGVTTLTKAEKYLERAIGEASKLGDGGEQLRFKEKLSKAVMKHGQVLRIILEKLEGEERSVVEQMIGEGELGRVEVNSNEELKEVDEEKAEEVEEKLIDNLKTLEN